MSLKGGLETFYLASLLQLLSTDQKTGVLQVSDGENHVKIFMKDGIIVYASSSKKELLLGHLLKVKGMISDEDLQKCLELGKVNRQKLGRVLVEEGYISMERLKELLHHQVKEILYWVFLWKTGQFEYRDLPISVDGALITRVTIMEVVLEASRRIDEWSVISEQITSDKLIFKISEEARETSQVTLNKHEWRILSLVDGTRTVRQVIDESRYDEFLAYKILYSLMLSGFMEKGRQEHVEKKNLDGHSAVISIYCDILQMIYMNLETELGHTTSAMFDECKAQLVPKQKSLLEGFDPTKQLSINTEAILGAMNTFKDLDEARAFLMQGFNSLLLGILDKETKVLGSQATQATLKGIKYILSYVKEHQKDATEKIKIANEIEGLLAQVGHRLEDKKEAKGRFGGILSLFRPR